MLRSLPALSALLILTSLAAPPTGAASAPTATEDGEPVADRNRWFSGPLDHALRAAGREDKLVLLYFWVPGSQQCVSFYEDTIKADAVVPEMGKFICLSISNEDASKYPLFERYGVTTVPAVRMITAEGSAVDGLDGNATAERYSKELERVARGEGTLTALLTQVEADPEDLDLRNLLAGKYQDLGNQEKHDELQSSIKADDPEGKTVVAAQLHLGDVLTTAFGPATTPQEIDLGLLRSHVDRIEPAQVRFNGLQNVAGILLSQGDFAGALETYHSSWEALPEASVLNAGNSLAEWLWSNRDALEKKDKQLALSMATASTELAAKLESGDDGYGNKYGGDDFKGFLADRLDLLGRCQYLNAQREQAIETLARCVELAAEHAEYTERLELYRKKEQDRDLTAYSDTSPEWSPNGKQVAYSSNRDGNWELYVASVKKGKETRLTRSSADEQSPTWSPDGKQVAFSSNRFRTNGIYTVGVDGSKPKLLRPFDPGNPVAATEPSFSPNGKDIAFVTTQNGKAEIAVMKSNGAEVRVLTASTPNTDMSPAWSPKGRQILYMSNRAGDADVYSISPDGEEDVNITRAPEGSWDMDPFLSPNGKKVLFASWRSGSLEVYVMNVDGSEVQDLTQSPETEDRHPSWSPNGRWIAFDRKTADGATRIHLMDADGSNVRPLHQD